MRSSTIEQVIFSATTKLQAAFTAAVTNICTSSAHGFMGDEKIRVSSSTTLPAGLAANTDYYVKVIDVDTFYLSTILGGPAVDITDTGTGTHTFVLLGRDIFVADFDNCNISLHTTGSANFNIKVKMSEQETLPNFKNAASSTNRWSFLQITDLASGTAVAGATGVTMSGVDVNNTYEANMNGCRWITAEISSYVAGSVHLSLTLSSNYF